MPGGYLALAGKAVTIVNLHLIRSLYTVTSGLLQEQYAAELEAETDLQNQCAAACAAQQVWMRFTLHALHIRTAPLRTHAVYLHECAGRMGLHCHTPPVTLHPAAT